MARIRSVDFLPEIFQTPVNRQFLAATLDTLIQEPRYKNTEGFIGRTVGPGVNPGDRYVVEPDKTRADYQLEPGVVSLRPDTDDVQGVITYPGISDAISFQGGEGARADRLYESEYYTWDPFVDFDSFVNFSQYYWLPSGPDPVDIDTSGIPTTDNFVVTRANGVYTFSGIAGENPQITLVRGGSYTFQVAQNDKQTVTYRVSNQGSAAYTIDNQSNPTLTLVRGNTYVFNLTLQDVYPFWIKTQPGTGTNNAYNSGVTRNGAATGPVTFVVPQDAPDILYYNAENQSNLAGVFNIIDGTPGTGAGFWIQSTPGVDGRLPTSPNISSRDVFGVINNGTDLGTVTFNVPSRTAQQFYYDLTPFATPVDLVTGLKFNEINNQRLDQFVATYGGIDGITALANRTLVFAETPIGTETGGWIRTTFFDPLPRNDASNGAVGSYDSTLFDQATEIPVADRRQLWQINIVVNNGIAYINLTKAADIPVGNKFSVRYGNVYSNTSWYKDSQGGFEIIPLLTAIQNTLYYQDGTDPGIIGTIQLVDEIQNATIFIDDILGSKNYTAPNGVVFTNGLKVVFRGDIVPASYGSGTIAFECTATSPQFNAITTDSTESLYQGQQIVFSAPTLGGLIAGRTYYVQTIINSFQFTVSEVLGGRAVPLQFGTGTMDAISINYREYYVAGVGSGIKLLPVQDFVTPESYVEDANDSTIATEPARPDYFTIDRASQDLNAWTRSNRWFHQQVINATAEYNNTVAVLDNNARAKRPILQFRPDIRLFNMGTQGKQPIDVIDFSETDAFSNIQGSLAYSVDGYNFVNGTRVIFAADADPDVKNKIWVVEFITPDTIPPLISQPIINLTLATDGLALADQSVLALFGTTTGGKTYWFDGVDWIQAQQKTSIQQAPLFNVYDPTGVSFGDRVKYPSSNFIGSKLFSYALSDSEFLDPILQLPLQFLNIQNIGDIVFDNNLYKDTFVYTRENISTVAEISSGVPREYIDRTQFVKLLGWQTAATDSKCYQQFKFVYDGSALKLDVSVSGQRTVPSIKIYVDSVFVDPSRYTFVTTADSTTITFLRAPVLGSVIEVLVLSDQTSRVAFYQVPINLENNPLNANSDSFTLGTIRQHYQSLCENLPGITGEISGSNNTRDLGNIVPYGLTILQQSAPLTMAGYFLHSTQYDIFAALTYNSREYFKLKNQMLDNVTKQTIEFQTAAQILDTALEELSAGKTEIQSFYWSDMLPQGAVYTQNDYTVGFVTTGTFDTVQVYNFTSANYLGLSVYVNNELLIRGRDYVVATDGPRLTIISELSVGDVVSIREYTSTAGNFIPNTPTKLGLYPAWEPEIITERTSTGTQQVIRGHDGSITPVFGDIRDEALLEFERRIYNNLKLDGNPVPLLSDEVIPGQFRTTGYSYAEVQNILNQDFLSYVAWNKLDYQTQDYRANNEFTYNYSRSTNKLDGEDLLGAWRGIYQWFYDTQQPQSRPWEMLGLSIKPLWWDQTYGAEPYTQDNLVLWDDLAAGIVRDPVGAYVVPGRERPRLTEVIPTSSQGQLLSPLQSVVENYDTNQFRRSWSPGDGGPVEASWWNSSLYPFAVMRLLAVTRPAKFFALFADRDRYRFNTEFDQYLYDDRYRLDANGLQVYGNGVSKASFINWIVDYNRQTGLDSTEILQADLANLDVRLCYRMASFSDKSYIKLYTEKATPDSDNTSFLIPDESYDLILYKNQPFERVSYSSVMVQRTTGGYAVFGYSTVQPYFNVLQGQAGGKTRTIQVAGISVQVPSSFTNTISRVPYGFVFNDEASVATFLLGYGGLLESQGMTFDNTGNGYQLDWTQMVVEFLYWTRQGWDENSIIALNPLAQRLQLTREQAVVDSIQYQTAENVLLDQNRRELPTRNLNIVRLDNTITIEPLNDQTLSYVDLRYTSYEHLIVLDNRSVFGDLIYDPITGARQSRLEINAVTTAEWNGSIDTQGFILNQNNVKEWDATQTYSKGEIVFYKGAYWSAARIVQPSTDFNYNDWLQSDYEQIEIGLLPNLANKADQLANTYSVNRANLEQDNDLFAYGLIGFRPRQYMAALGLDDVSQVNVYRQFLGSKGTLLSTELFRRADLGKESADYEIFENWAVQRAVYGANANRSFVEFRLDRALLDANPSVIQVVEPQQSSEADQAILLSNVWRESFPLTSTQIFPVEQESITDTALPSAGYVNIDDADITIFDLRQPGVLNEVADEIGVGTSIWVARVNDYDWNIYRAEAVPGNIAHVCDNLDQTSLVIFTAQHGLQVGDQIVIRFFDTEVDGVYDVLSVPTLEKITIAFSFTGNRTAANGTGLAFTLATMRTAQLSDVVNLPYANTVEPGARVWVDDIGNGRWAVVQKQDVFSNLGEISPQTPELRELYGSSVAQAGNRFAALAGAPGYGLEANGKDTGAVYVYVRSQSDAYAPVSPIENSDAVLTLTNPAIRGYGGSVAFGDRTWAVAGASSSLGVTNAGNFIPGSTYIIHSAGTSDFISAGAAARAQFTASISGRIMTVSSVTFGTIAVNSFLSGSGIPAGTYVSRLLSATGTTGTYQISAAVTASGITIQTFHLDDQFVATNPGSGTGTALGVTTNRGHGYACVINQDLSTYTSGTNPYSNWQLLVDPDSPGSGNGELGFDVAISKDERWIYLGAPGSNKVLSYGRVDWQDQFINFSGDGFTVEYVINDTIQIDDNEQIQVFLNSTLQMLDTDYTVATDFSAVVFDSAPAAGDIIRIQRLNVKELDREEFFSYAATPIGPVTGTGARFTLVRRRNTLTVEVDAGGTGYVTGDQFLVPGTVIWPNGSSPANDIVITVSTSGGSITSVTDVSYTPPDLEVAFELGRWFFTATNIDSVSIFVDGVLQLPYVDYTWNNVTRSITFVRVPGVGASIIARAKGYWLYAGKLEVVGLDVGARFGASVNCTTDGRQILIGAPDQSVVIDGDTRLRAGQTFVFDRNVQKFVYAGDPSSVAFEILGTLTEPVSVIVNNQFLVNQQDATVDSPNSFTVMGNQVTLYDEINSGTVVEIETNQFALVQTMQQQIPEVFANYGQATEICGTDCSLYAGAPQSSVQIYKGGVVERRVNQGRAYGTLRANNSNPTLIPGTTLRINDIDVMIRPAPLNTLTQFAADITAQVPNVTALNPADTSGLLTLVNTNPAAALPDNKINVLPGSIGDLFNELEFEIYAFTQTIVSPFPTEFAAFGSAISVSEQATEMIVGSPQGTMYLVTIFDDGTTPFDAGASTFFSAIQQSGTVYVYNLAASANPSVANPSKFVIGQQISVTDLAYLDRFGSAVDYRSGVLWMGAPGSDLGDSANENVGHVVLFENPSRSSAWVNLRVESDVVDIRLLNSVFLYNVTTSATTEFLDFFNPLQGKVLGAARQNIDYISAIDPAGYNVGPTAAGNAWGAARVGEIWWDISQVRFIDSNQGDLTYKSRRWGQIFPGSTVAIYQWTVSDVPPASYVGEGIPLNTVDYSVAAVLSDDGVFTTQYFFWVRSVTTVATSKGKTLSADTVARYIEDPRSTGIAYLAPIDASTVALYNCETLIEAQDTVLHVEFDRQLTTDNVHVEYELIPEGNASGWISNNLYRKLQDSLCGVDTAGNLVPDIFLSPPERYGVQFRPRQSMFVNRFVALKNYITRANEVLARYPISETRTFNLLNSRDPEPSASSGRWNLKVANLEILSFQNIYQVPLGYAYLVETDSSQSGRWTIYTVVQREDTSVDSTLNRELLLTGVQGYVTPDYWQFIDWYQPGYNPSVQPVAEVQNFAQLDTLTVSVGSSVRVRANAQGLFEIYQRTPVGWNRVGLQNGTIELSAELYDYQLGRFGFDVEVFDAQYFDQEPTTETRKIIQAINEELFVDDLLIERNNLLILIFNYVLSESVAPEWLVKTSLIDVRHRIRELLPFQNYNRDNQEFVLDYLQEVKPYHVQVREFSLNYFGSDSYFGDITDFDLPAYFNTSLDVPQFTSPILLPYEQGTAQVSNILSNVPASAEIWQTWPYSQWFSNYLLDLDFVEIIDGGSGYTEPPQVTISGTATQPAVGTAIINASGQVVGVVLTTSGVGYREEPSISFVGGNGTGARAVARMINALIRQFRTTVKFDRVQYRTRVLEWSADGTYENGTLVRYLDRIWQANNQDGSSAVVGPTFDLENWDPVNPAALTLIYNPQYNYYEVSSSTPYILGVDRTAGLYVAGVNSPGLDLPVLIPGIDYPGVQVWGRYFTSQEILDADYQSQFTDTELGIRPSDIIADGGAFIGPFEGHAPEELCNGSEFDTLDMRVFTRPGSDWQEDGHGFQIATRNYFYDTILDPVISWAGWVENPVQILVSNQTTSRDLVLDLDYTVDWINQTVTPIPGQVNDGDLISVSVYETGGGSQLYRQRYLGSEIPTGVFDIPVNSNEIQSIAIFINGEAELATPSWVPYIASESWNIINSYPLNSVVNNAGSYYRSVQAVPPGTELDDTDFWAAFVPTLESRVTMAVPPSANDAVSIVVFGITTVVAGDFIVGRQYTITSLGSTDFVALGAATNEVGEMFVATAPGGGTGTASTVYSWSTPEVQYVTADSQVVNDFGFQLTNSISGSNTANMIVTRNGLRLTPPAGIEWIGDGTSVSFGLPQRMGASFLQSSINAITDIKVWVDDILQSQSFGSFVGDYSVTNWNGSNTPGRQVVFVEPPRDGAQILISVSTIADYIVAGDFLEIISPINLGDEFAVTTWNDVSQQDLLTLIFVGPVISGVTLDEPYDSTGYDAGLISFGPGSFDFSTGTSVATNQFDLQRQNVVASRIWVTLDGERLFEGQDFTVQGQELILASGAIGLDQVLAVTQFTNSVVPEAAAFRIFQDMRGIQRTYRITESTTTTLSQAVSATDQIIYVENIAALSEPDLQAGIFGSVTINGERISYRERDLVNGAITGLRRGIAGTAASAHAIGSAVYNIGPGNELINGYMDYYVSDSEMADGSTTVYYAPNISITDFGDSSSIYVESIEVYVGGIRQYNYSDTTAISQYPWIVTDAGGENTPLTIEFITNDDPVNPDPAPPAGQLVTIRQRRGQWWYAVDTALERNLSLQESETQAARFLTGR
jgi:hypothetical protein